MKQSFTTIPCPPYHKERTDECNYSADTSRPQSGRQFRMGVYEIITILRRCIREYAFKRTNNGRGNRRCHEGRQRLMMVCHRDCNWTVCCGWNGANSLASLSLSLLFLSRFRMEWVCATCVVIYSMLMDGRFNVMFLCHQKKKYG